LAKSGTAALPWAPFAGSLQQPAGYIGALDGVRGIAIILVLIYHFGRDSAAFLNFDHSILRFSAFGWVGVDLFFVLSGFLITGILYDSRHSENYLRNFYVRRVLRIFPLYYGAIVLLIVFSYMWPGRGVMNPHSIPWLVAYLSNVLIALEGWWAIGGPLAHWWSLAVEEHFYLVWPFILLWGTRLQLIAVASALVLAAPILRTILVLWDFAPSTVYVLTLTRMDALAVGALCGLVIRGPGGVAGVRLPAAGAAIACSIALIVIASSRWTVSEYDPVIQSVGYSLLALAFGGAILVTLTWRPLNAVVDNGILRWFGRYSYGLYLWHPIAIALLFGSTFASTLDGTPAKVLFTLLVIGVAVLVAVISYHCWEKPFLRLKRSFS
jgi:peptidoglycan/LPS O-acetylase OafA/YrhL